MLVLFNAERTREFDCSSRGHEGGVGALEVKEKRNGGRGRAAAPKLGRRMLA